MLAVAMCLWGRTLPPLPPNGPMHICDDHKEMLPEGIPPMLMPDTQEDAVFLLSFLKCGFFLSATATEEADVLRQLFDSESTSCQAQENAPIG